MAITSQNILSCLVNLFQSHQNIQVCVKQSVRGGLIAGTMTGVGGLLLGPAGLAVGGILGGLTAAATASSYKPIYEIIQHDLTPAQQAQLVNDARRVIREFNIVDAAALGMAVMQNASFQNAMVSVVTHCLQDEFHMSIRE